MSAARGFGAVIVNYNCAPLALDAALSFLGAGGARAVIVDNASPDGSALFLRRAISGEIAHAPVAPPDPVDGHAPSFADIRRLQPDALGLIMASGNGGFAAGCNIGLRSLAATPGLDGFLLLNPDAVIARGALVAFAERLADAAVGLCGATVVGFDAPHAVQAFGGAAFNDILLTGRNLGQGARIESAPDRKAIEAKLDYPLGAAIALRKDYLARAGYLDERYFLYYEEADWALAGGAGLRPAWAPGAVVYHRYGAASKSRKTDAGAPSQRSPLSDYHMARSRLLFAVKWRPLAAPVAVAAGVAQASRRLARGRRRNAVAVLRGSLPGSPRAFI